jgi:CDP-diacylglycerol--glycerol-3-phosphate 3-phosphatidyltransferase
MNLPNSITMTRIVMIPLFLWILSPHFPWQGQGGTQEILASILFVLASITDGLDGYLARRRGQITTIGMLLDPLADKIMVTAAFVALVAYNPQVVKVWIVVVIIGREFDCFVGRIHHHGQRVGKTEDRGADCLGGFGDPGAPLGLLADWRVRHSGKVVCDRCDLLHRSRVHHLCRRLLHRLLEEDRSRLERPP